MVLQMPVFIGFFLHDPQRHRIARREFPLGRDLAKPDTLFMIPGTSFPFNLLPLLMGATMLWQSHLTPASPAWTRPSKR